MAMGDKLLSTFPPGSDWRRVESAPVERAKALEILEPMWATHVADTQGVMEEAIERRNAILARQRRTVWALGMLSPGSRFTMAATSLSATGQAEYQRWNAAASDYEKALNRLLFHNPSRLTLLVAAQPPSPVGRTGRWIVSLSRRPPVRLDTLPAFVAPHTTFAQRLRDGLGSLLVLGGLAVALVWASGIAFNRLRL